MSNQTIEPFGGEGRVRRMITLSPLRRAIAGVALLAAMITPSAHGASTSDWILVSVTAGPSGATELTVRVSGNARALGTEPALIGFGFADITSSMVDIIPAGSGSLRLSSTTAAGGLDLTVLPGAGGRELLVEGTLLYDVLRPFERVAILIFVPGMSFDALGIEQLSAASGSVTSWSLSGAGSSSIDAAGPQDDGVGAAVGPAAVGSSSVHHRHVEHGVIGGFVTTGFCVACSGSWRAPDGGSGSFATGEADVVGLTSGSSSFAGPDGDWSWTWSGMGLTRSGSPGSTAIAAFAPVGDAWPVFRPLGV